MFRRAQCEGCRGKISISLLAFRTKCWFGGSNSIDLHVFYRLLRYAFRAPKSTPPGTGDRLRLAPLEVACFLGPIATRTSRTRVSSVRLRPGPLEATYFPVPIATRAHRRTCFLGPMAARAPRSDMSPQSDCSPDPRNEMFSPSDRYPHSSKGRAFSVRLRPGPF